MGAWAERSEQITEVSKAFVDALGELEDVTKNKKANAGQYEYGYADLATTVAMTRKVLSKHGLAVTQTAAGDGEDVVVYTTVLHSSGQFLTAEPLRLPAGKTAQQTGSALSYGRRYALMAFLGLATEDDDGAGASPRVSRGGQARKPAEAVRNDSRGQSVESRTSEEAEMRRILTGLPADRIKEVRQAFKAEFGVGLSDLPVERHGEALSWVETFAN